MYPLPPVEQIRRDLTAHLYAFALMVDRCVRLGAGCAVLNLAPDAELDHLPKYDDFDLTAFPMAAGLDSVYRYAAFGELRPALAVEHLSMDPTEGALGRMHLLVQTFGANPEGSYCMDEVAADLDEADVPRSGFRDMVELAVSREALDAGLDLTPGQVALLANVSERTVANAMAMKGESRLEASRDADGRVVIIAKEADRWLGGRRAFLATVSVRATEALPEVLSAKDLATYISTRIHEKVPDSGLNFDAMKNGEICSTSGQQRLATICRVLGWSQPRAQAWMDGNVEALDLDDCKAAADMLLHVDSQWLTSQLMNAKFPAFESRLEATLTEAGIRSGYFDIEQRFARAFFPGDSFGGRGTDEIGAPIQLHVDGKSYETDIRVKSQALVSPRKRFTAYFKSHQAKPDDKVCITRIGERNFELIFIGK